MACVFLDTDSCYLVHALVELSHARSAFTSKHQATDAAKRSFLSQSAMSSALVRLREMFGDPLTPRFRGAVSPSS
jgi:hypothetical protein